MWSTWNSFILKLVCCHQNPYDAWNLGVNRHLYISSSLLNIHMEFTIIKKGCSVSATKHPPPSLALSQPKYRPCFLSPPSLRTCKVKNSTKWWLSPYVTLLEWSRVVATSIGWWTKPILLACCSGVSLRNRKARGLSAFNL